MLCYAMPFNLQPSNELLKKPFDEMWSNLVFRPQKDKMKQQRSSKSCSKNVNKLKTKSVVDEPCHNEKLETLREIFQRESVEESSTSTQSEELIKYMSNLPGYLKRSDRGKNVQEKALNVGVLDWSQLEKWRNMQSHIPLGISSEESTSSSRAATTSSTSNRGHRKLYDRKGLHSSVIKGSYKEALPKCSKLSSHNLKQYQYSETEKILSGEHRMTSREFESIGKTQLDTSLQKEKRSEYDVEVKSMKSLQQHSLRKKERNLNCSDKGLPSLEPKDKGVSFGSQKKMSSRSNEVKKEMDRWPEPEVDVDRQQCHGMPRDIVLLRPRKFLQSRFDDYFPLSRSMTSSDENFSESSQSSSSYISIPGEFHTEDAYFETRHSSVLLPSVTNLDSSSETTRHRVNIDLDVDGTYVTWKKPECSNKMSSFQPKGTCIEKDVLDFKLINQRSFSNVKESKDNETAELTAERVRNNSSQSQIDFGLNRIGRSSSFKEGTNLPKLSSMYVNTKSGPVTSESSVCLDNSSKDKVKGHKRSKSSPFMRLLDPLRKHKSSYIDHSSETSLTPKGSMKSISFRTSNLNAEESKESSTQAILQLTIKNGLPLFKFVLNSERKVFAATMNSLASLEKDDGSCYFTFYLLNEIKKKSGKWMSHWSKEKKCGFVYNIVGQMKISSSKIIDSSTRCTAKDYVLFGVGVAETDQGTKEFIKSREHAAAVIEIPCEGVHLMKKECLKCLLANETCFCISQEIDSSGSVTVILPGGVHSSPIKGEPSPLIHRWKLGGLCDCGGWDVGCKLLVLSNQNPSSKPHPKRFQLFVKEEAEQSTPLFILEPLKDGLYSVEFSSTINHLQAFFISVAVLSSQKLPSSLEMSNKQGEINEELSLKNNNEHQEKATINYNTIPPLSPVHRV